MADDNDTGKLPGVPEPDPPKGGPNADPDSPDPADLTPGFGGTSETRPTSTEEEPES